MKILVILAMVMVAAVAQIISPIPLVEKVKICERTQGIWNSTTGECECPEGFELDEKTGCYNAGAEDICRKTGGVWISDNRRIPPVYYCDCGLAKEWNELEGCTGGILATIMNFLRSLIPSYLWRG